LPRLLQVGKVLANDPTGRSQFVHSGGLAAVQQMAEAPDSKLKEAVDIINSCYPEEVVRYYSPSYRCGMQQHGYLCIDQLKRCAGRCPRQAIVNQG
jgi:hypothetical protein